MLGEVAFSSAFTQMQSSWEICCLNSQVCSRWTWSTHPGSDAGWRGVPVLVRKGRADLTTFKHTVCFKLDVFKQK